MATNYIKIRYGNSCDLGNVYYAGGFRNRVYFDSALGKPEFVKEEDGYENDEGVFIKTTERLVKNYRMVVTGPEYIVDALTAMALCDDVIITDTDGIFFHQARNIEVTPTWEDNTNGCLATIEIKYQVDDQISKTNCCVNM